MITYLVVSWLMLTPAGTSVEFASVPIGTKEQCESVLKMAEESKAPVLFYTGPAGNIKPECVTIDLSGEQQPPKQGGKETGV